MYSFLYSLVAKAHRYAAEPARRRVEQLAVRLDGDHGAHAVRLAGARLVCDCAHHTHQGVCAHVLAVGDLFRAHLPADAIAYPARSTWTDPAPAAAAP
jgi:hypothetical protein